MEPTDSLCQPPPPFGPGWGRPFACPCRNAVTQRVSDARARYPTRLFVLDAADGQVCAILFWEHRRLRY